MIVPNNFPSLPHPRYSSTLRTIPCFPPLSLDDILHLQICSNLSKCPLDPVPPTMHQCNSHDLLPSNSYIRLNIMCHLPTLLLDQLVLILLEFSETSCPSLPAWESLAQHGSGYVSSQKGWMYRVTWGGSAPCRLATGALKAQCLVFVCFLSTLICISALVGQFRL